MHSLWFVQWDFTRRDHPGNPGRVSGSGLVIHLSGISISSVFPNSLLNRSSLISLDLSLCGLHGRFPDNDIHLPKLELLSLWENCNLNGNFS